MLRRRLRHSTIGLWMSVVPLIDGCSLEPPAAVAPVAPLFRIGQRPRVTLPH